MRRYRLLADDWPVVFNGEAGHVTVAEGADAQTLAVLDEGLWAQLVEQASNRQRRIANWYSLRGCLVSDMPLSASPTASRLPPAAP